MSLSNSDQELLDKLYPKGYEVEPTNMYHLLFKKIFVNKNSEDNKVVGMVQVLNKRDYDVLMRQVEKGWKLSAITGYNKFVIIHDPAKSEKVKQPVSTPVPDLKAEPQAEVKEPVETEPTPETPKAKEVKETKKKPGPKPKVES